MPVCQWLLESTKTEEKPRPWSPNILRIQSRHKKCTYQSYGTDRRAMLPTQMCSEPFNTHETHGTGSCASGHLCPKHFPEIRAIRNLIPVPKQNTQGPNPQLAQAPTLKGIMTYIPNSNSNSKGHCRDPYMNI